MRLMESTPDVLEGLKKRCIRFGMAYDIELFLFLVHKWDRKQELKIVSEIKIGNDDIRALVSFLPEEKQTQYYETIATLLAEAESARRSGKI